MNSSNENAKNIRAVIRYLRKFNKALFVIYLEDTVIESSLFSSHIRDIALLHQAGFKVIIIPGAKSRIDEILTSSKKTWTYKDELRVTNEESMELIKMAAFDVSNKIMTSLAANNLTALIGNWVKAKSKGVINGFDFGTAGEIEKLEMSSIQKVLDDGFIPIFPCIGWSSSGHPYNISSVELAQQVAINLKAEKLFYMINDVSFSEGMKISKGLVINEENRIVAMDIFQVEEFLSLNKNHPNKILSIYRIAKEACKNGVVRTHIVDSNIDGVLPCEIFSDLGTGTMIYTRDYGNIRPMQISDIPSVMNIIKPFINEGRLLYRSENDILQKINDYIVYEFDGGIHGCCALHLYSDNQTEIAAVAVDKNYNHTGIGPKMINFLVQRAKEIKAKSVFIMTTQSVDWFEKLGFVLDTIDSLPKERRDKWNPERNSKVLRLKNF